MSSNSNSGSQVRSFMEDRFQFIDAQAINTDSKGYVRQYCNLIDNAIDERGYGHSLFRLTPDLLAAKGCKVYAILDKSQKEILCALHTIRDKSDNFYWINGLVKASGGNSIVAKELMAKAIIATNAKLDRPTYFQACYRVFPPWFKDKNGSRMYANKASANIFEVFAFENTEIEPVKISGGNHDKHLLQSAEIDGVTFRTQIVRSTEETLHRAREFISILNAIQGF